MKGIIVDIEGKKAIVLCKDGEFKKISCLKNFEIGLEVEVKDTSSFNFIKFSKISSIAATFILILSIGFISYLAPYNYLYIDINPSIKITSNIFSKIIAIKAVNADAKSILPKDNLIILNVDSAVEKIIENAYDRGYLSSSSENAILVTVSSKNDKAASKMSEQVNKALQIKLKTLKVSTNILNQSISSNKFYTLKNEKVSPGKMMLLEKLKAENPDIDIDTYKNRSVSKIVKEINLAKYKGKDKKVPSKTPKDTSSPLTDINNKNNNSSPSKDSNNEDPTVTLPPSKDSNKTIETNLSSKKDNKHSNVDSSSSKDSNKTIETNLSPKKDNKLSNVDSSSSKDSDKAIETTLFPKKDNKHSNTVSSPLKDIGTNSSSLNNNNKRVDPVSESIKQKNR